MAGFTFLRTSVTTRVPTLAQLPIGQLAINMPDGKLFLRQGSGIGTDVIVDLTSPTYAKLPTSAQYVPIGFSFSGKPTASQVVNLPAGQALTVPANFAGTTSYTGTLPTANMVFTLNRIAGGTTLTALGTVTLLTTGKINLTLSTQAAVSIANTDVFQLVAPSTQDTTGADIGITFLMLRV